MVSFMGSDQVTIRKAPPERDELSITRRHSTQGASLRPYPANEPRTRLRYDRVVGYDYRRW
jgi:hypothetical protein